MASSISWVRGFSLAPRRLHRPSNTFLLFILFSLVSSVPLSFAHCCLSPLRFIYPQVTAVFAADAVARLSGVPGVAAVTAGPGLTNTITAVKNCQMAETPLVLIGGAAATLLKGRGALQDIDQMALFKPLCKYCATITR